MTPDQEKILRENVRQLIDIVKQKRTINEQKLLTISTSFESFSRVKKLINKDAIYESLVAFKRAGANAIVSYYADRIDKIIK